MTIVTREEKLRRLMWIIMAAYMLALLRFTLFKYVPITRLPDAFFLRERECNIIPFKAIYEMIKGLSSLRLAENIAGNIILFIPFGLIFPLASVFEGETPVYGFITSLLIEIAQYGFAMGAADIDDIILNVIGVLIGYKILYRMILLRIFKERETMLTVMALILGIGLTAALFVMYYADYLVNGFPNLTF